MAAAAPLRRPESRRQPAMVAAWLPCHSAQRRPGPESRRQADRAVLGGRVSTAGTGVPATVVLDGVGADRRAQRRPGPESRRHQRLERRWWRSSPRARSTKAGTGVPATAAEHDDRIAALVGRSTKAGTGVPATEVSRQSRSPLVAIAQRRPGPESRRQIKLIREITGRLRRSTKAGTGVPATADDGQVTDGETKKRAQRRPGPESRRQHHGSRDSGLHLARSTKAGTGVPATAPRVAR